MIYDTLWWFPEHDAIIRYIKSHILHTDRHILVRETHWTSTAEDPCRTLDEDPGQCGRSQRGEHGHPARANCHGRCRLLCCFFFLSWEYGALLCRSRVLKTYFQIRNWIYDIHFAPSKNTHTTNPCGTGSSTQQPPLDGKLRFSSTRHGVITREFSESVYRCLPPAHWQPGPEDIKGRLLQRQMGFFGISLGRGHGLKRWFGDFGNCEENFFKFKLILIPASDTTDGYYLWRLVRAWCW